MRQLRSCDFCGADAAGVYEPLPPDLAAEQRRVALCPECRDTLAGLLEPLRGAGGRDAPDAVGGGGEPPNGDCTTRAVTVEPADWAFDDAGSRDESGADSGSEADSDDRTADGASAGRSADRPRGYRKLIRLVSNRESAVTRADLREVAASAYGIDAEQAKRALDAAVANGDLVEDEDRLRVP